MKRTTAILLVALAVIMLVSCSAKNGRNKMADDSDQTLETIFQTVCSADDALDLARDSGLPVFERQGCTSGNEVWDTFFRTVSKGEPASVLCAHYYILDKEHMSAELYAEEKDKYPKLFFYLVEYDGTEYSVKARESTVETPDYQKSFKYLLHFTGEAPSTALFSNYDNYVLVDDPSATWEGIEAGLFSSVSGAGYKHCTVYRNCLGWKGE